MVDEPMIAVEGEVACDTIIITVVCIQTLASHGASSQYREFHSLGGRAQLSPQGPISTGVTAIMHSAVKCIASSRTAGSPVSHSAQAERHLSRVEFLSCNPRKRNVHKTSQMRY